MSIRDMLRTGHVIPIETELGTCFQVQALGEVIVQVHAQLDTNQVVLGFDIVGEFHAGITRVEVSVFRIE